MVISFSLRTGRFSLWDDSIEEMRPIERHVGEVGFRGEEL